MNLGKHAFKNSKVKVKISFLHWTLITQYIVVFINNSIRPLTCHVIYCCLQLIKVTKTKIEGVMSIHRKTEEERESMGPYMRSFYQWFQKVIYIV